MIVESLRRARPTVALVAGLLATTAAPALAGEDIVFGAPADWVERRDVPTTGTAQYALYDAQHRLEKGVVSSYIDLAVRIATPEAATQSGTVQMAWFPDKGDLTVHEVTILRGAERIDVLKSTKFDVLRRERGLEQRLLDGQLTATMAVPGLRVGDILRVAYSTTTADQALGKEMQLLQPLFPYNPSIGAARTIVSWPASEPVRFAAERGAPATAQDAGGYKRVEIALPLAKVPDMPGDAPRRYSAMPVLRVGTYADWQELSRDMHPHFDKAAAIAPGSALDGEVRRIMAQTTDPKARAALALRAVQDEISYLLNGLAGGNYLPQNAEDSWRNRYGDCKAKSVLLTAMLRRMDIAADPVLVSTTNGDGLPGLLPVPGNFDHMIVRAAIDGTDYWLDGTSAGGRIGTLDAAPAFSHALPLTRAGSGLVPIVQRPRSEPTMKVDVRADYSAGVDLPQLYTVVIEMSGPQAASVRPLAESQDPEQLRQMRASFANEMEGYAAISDVKLSYDEDRAVARFDITGAGESEFAWDRQRLAMGPDADLSEQTFDADRAKPEWRTIPVATRDGGRTLATQTIILPAAGFTVDGPATIEGAFANTTVRATAGIEGREARFSSLVEQLGGEIAPADIAEAKRGARKLAAQSVKLVAPAGIERRWQVAPATLARRTAPIAAVFDKAVAQAEKDDTSALDARAQFRGDIFDFAGSLADYQAIGAKEPSAENFVTQANLLTSLGRNADALAAWRKAYDLDPQNWVIFGYGEELAYNGRAAEGEAVLAEAAVGDDEIADYTYALAFVQALGGKSAEALKTADDALLDRPDNASLLNTACWLRGLFNIGVDSGAEVCTRAVERARSPAGALDSRAMLRFRQGDYAGAIADLDAALALQPELAASLYLRGLAKQALGDAGAKADLDAGTRLAPNLPRRYAFHKVMPAVR